MRLDTVGSDHFPVTIRMDEDRRFPSNYVVCWDYYQTHFQKDTIPIEEHAVANLHYPRIFFSFGWILRLLI